MSIQNGNRRLLIKTLLLKWEAQNILSKYSATSKKTLYRTVQGLVKGAKLGLAGEVSWLAVEVLSPC